MIRLTLALALIAAPAAARDLDGRYAKLDPKMHEWFEHLHSGKGPCCSDADGRTVLDSDWEVVNSHYRVFLDGQWLDVPDDAVLTQPNLYGRTVVWPIKMFAGMTIRCFSGIATSDFHTMSPFAIQIEHCTGGAPVESLGNARSTCQTEQDRLDSQ